MDYIINDIVSLAHLNKLGLIKPVCSCCSDIGVTNIRLNNFSSTYKKQIINLFNDSNIRQIEVDIDFYAFSFSNEHLMKGLGDGDKSSIYQSIRSGYTIVTSNNEVEYWANYYKVNVVRFSDFIYLCNNDNELKSMNSITRAS